MRGFHVIGAVSDLSHDLPLLTKRMKYRRAQSKIGSKLELAAKLMPGGQNLMDDVAPSEAAGPRKPPGWTIYQSADLCPLMQSCLPRDDKQWCLETVEFLLICQTEKA